MTYRRRFASIVLMLLSQVAGGAAVLCDEGLGRQVVEFLPGGCCEAATAGGSTSPRMTFDEDPCGPCRDVPLLLVLQREDERQGSPQLAQPTVLPCAAWLASPPGQPGVAAVAAEAAAYIPTTVSRLVGTLILRC